MNPTAPHAFCWRCKVQEGFQVVMNGVPLKAVHNREHALLIIEQFEIGRIGRLRDTYELVPIDLSSKEVILPHVPNLLKDE